MLIAVQLPQHLDINNRSIFHAFGAFSGNPAIHLDSNCDLRLYSLWTSAALLTPPITSYTTWTLISSGKIIRFTIYASFSITMILHFLFCPEFGLLYNSNRYGYETQYFNYPGIHREPLSTNEELTHKWYFFSLFNSV